MIREGIATHHPGERGGGKDGREAYSLRLEYRGDGGPDVL